MIHWIDGYNFLFYLFKDVTNLQSKREFVVQTLRQYQKNKEICLIFDGTYQSKLEPSFSYYHDLLIIYTPKGQTADSYMIEELSYEKHPEKITVVSSDKNLLRNCRDLGASVQTIASFIKEIKKEPSIKDKKKPDKESNKEIDRLLNIFEERLKNEDFNNE